MGKVNVFGKTYDALTKAADGDGRTLTVESVEPKEARAINVLVICAFSFEIRQLGKEYSTSEDLAFIDEMKKAEKAGTIFAPGKFSHYDEAAKTLKIDLPAERIFKLQDCVRNMHSQIFADKKATGRTVLPRQGTPLCVIYGLTDETNTVGGKVVAFQMWRFLEAMATAHGFKGSDITFTSLENDPPLTGIKKTALEEIAKSEILESRGQSR